MIPASILRIYRRCYGPVPDLTGYTVEFRRALRCTGSGQREWGHDVAVKRDGRLALTSWSRGSMVVATHEAANLLQSLESRREQGEVAA